MGARFAREQVHRLDVGVPDDGIRTGARRSMLKIHPRHDTAQQTDYALAPNGKRALFSGARRSFHASGGTRQHAGSDRDHQCRRRPSQLVAGRQDDRLYDRRRWRAANRHPPGGRRRGEDSDSFHQRASSITPLWSPDGEQLTILRRQSPAMARRRGQRRAEAGRAGQFKEIHDYSFSPDGRWLAYSLTGANQQRGIWLYNIAANRSTARPQPRDNDFNPVFSPDGKYLYFISTGTRTRPQRARIQYRHGENGRHLCRHADRVRGLAVRAALRRGHRQKPRRTTRQAAVWKPDAITSRSRSTSTA